MGRHTWCLFLVEFVVKLAISPRRSLYLRRNWFDLLVIVLFKRRAPAQL